MFEVERLEHILSYLRQKQTASVHVLSKRLFVSEATVRRDLNELEKQGLIKRVHGGAVLLDSTAREVPLYVREQQNGDAKRKIAAQAARHLRDGQVIFLDASSTVMYLIKHLQDFHSMTIITNGLKTAQELRESSHKVYCTGGLLLHNSSAYVGEYATDFVRHFNADLFFFSSRGVTEDGRITDASAEETLVRRAMFEQSSQKIFLCDRSKLGQMYCYNLCSVKQVNDYIMDNGAYPNHSK